MYQYYVFEIQKYADGTFGHLVHWASDEDADKARMKAESKYHEVLAAAAVSALPQHAAALLASDGTELMRQCYFHAAPELEPEPELEVPAE